MTLPQPWRKLLLTAHIAASVGVFGADLSLLALGIASVGGADPVTIYPAASLVSSWLLAPLALTALVTGVLLGLLTQWGLFTYWWVVLKLTIVVILSGAVLFVLAPSLAAMADAAAELTPGFTAGERLPLLIAPAVASSLLLVALTLAIFKPGWRVRSSSVAATS